MSDHVDFLIVGAGLSGIGAACHFHEQFPERTYTILESRDAIGGTWDLFRYPGIRSDSDMYTLGYKFRPWLGEKAIADGPSILDYVRDTAAEYGIDEHVRYGHRVLEAWWDTASARWTVGAAHDGEIVTLTANFLMVCSGYYRYDEGYTPDFPGIDRFGGRIIHPQHWPEDLDYTGKRVVIIGSGATAVTLAPAMASDAASVVVLQRSPTYIMSLPSRDAIADKLRSALPPRVAYALTRAKNISVATAIYQLCQRYPQAAREKIRGFQTRWLPKDYDIDTHFKPTYDPWDQRLCLVPDGDLFRAIRKGTVEMVTDHVDTFTETGVRLRSGRELDADVVVTATGLNLLAFGGMQLTVDGEPVDLTQTMAYKGMMLSGVPNFAYIVGYTNASWTLKADLVCEYVGRLLERMSRDGTTWAVPERDSSVTEEPFLDFAAGYVLRSVDSFPKQGSKAPWRLRMNYFYDVVTLRRGSVTDSMRFGSKVPVSVG